VGRRGRELTSRPEENEETALDAEAREGKRKGEE
jgi:hypothetical protein